MKLQRHAREVDGQEDGVVYSFFCPGCEELHLFTTLRARRPVWTFNGDMANPTFAPSLLYPDKTPRCHLFLREGKLQFCSDCGHKLAGQTVDLPEIPEEMRW